VPFGASNKDLLSSIVLECNSCLVNSLEPIGEPSRGKDDSRTADQHCSGTVDRKINCEAISSNETKFWATNVSLCGDYNNASCGTCKKK
jgi:hypothetical protein